VYEEVLGINQDLGGGLWAVHCLMNLCSSNLHLGRYEEAGARAQAGLALARKTSVKYAIGDALVTLGCAALAEGAYAEAGTALRQGADVYGEIGHKHDLSRAVALLGCAARGQGRLVQAAAHLTEALQLGLDTGTPLGLLWALPVTALLLADLAQAERAIEVYALAERDSFVANSRWFADIAGWHIAAVAATLPPDVVVAAREHGREHDLQSMAQELFADLES
jgi:tetratricopeptide (TPR) repeat protein